MTGPTTRGNHILHSSVSSVSQQHHNNGGNGLILIQSLQADIQKQQDELTNLRDEYQKMITSRFGVPKKPVTM